MRTDAELLEQFAREGAQEAYAELVRRHVAMVYGAALRHVAGDAHLAQDVTQTVFAALARKASGVAERGALAGWLYLSAHHARRAGGAHRATNHGGATREQPRNAGRQARERARRRRICHS